MKTQTAILIEDIETYLTVSAGHYDEAGEAESLLEDALKELVAHEVVSKIINKK